MSRIEKTLVILTPGFAESESDTTCLPMQQSFIKKLKERFSQLNIIILAFQYPYIKKTYSWFGSTVHSFNGQNKGGLTKLWLRQRLQKTLREIHSKNNICGLLSFWYGECAWAGKKMAAKYRIPHYCWMWGQDARKQNKYPLQVQLKAGELIAFSDFLQAEFERNFGIQPLHIITPGIDISEFGINKIEKDIDIVAAGSLIPLKQYSVFIEVIAEIKKKIPHLKVILIGDGLEKSMLKEMIRTLALEENVTLTGELPHPELIQTMQRSKLFLHTSSYEGFGIVCIEALCAGAKVISFTKPMNEVAENWHIASGKEEMIVKAIQILQDPENEYKRVVPYSIEQTVQKMADLFSLQPIQN